MESKGTNYQINDIDEHFINIKNNLDIQSNSFSDSNNCIITTKINSLKGKNFENKGNNSEREKRNSFDCEIKTENNNSLIVEMDDQDYMNYQDLDYFNTIDNINNLENKLIDEKVDRLSGSIQTSSLDNN